MKWINITIENLNCIKSNALLKVKYYMYYKSTEFISKTIPYKEYKKSKTYSI